METETKEVTKKEKAKGALLKTESFILRWFYLILFLAVAAYAAWAWDNLVYYADWSEEKKKSYINEQVVFSFDRGSYQKAVDLIKSRKEKLESDNKFSGRDVFFPEGF